MRLIHTSTLEVVDFPQRDLPEYAILSHTWADDEVTFQDMRSKKALEGKGYKKILGCCSKAFADGLTYCWVDTCCIDKTSSAELSEAINSMYRWYKQSMVCYVYLSDVDGISDDKTTGDLGQTNFDRARWWTRGWTLQELIAPSAVEFYDRSWKELGTKLSLRNYIQNITGISGPVLGGFDPERCNVAVRMSWAARRETTRLEDQAYCLLGLFGVNMPLLYGEGEKAFMRLQEEILRVAEDYTLFAWSSQHFRTDDPWRSEGLLARDVSYFATLEPIMAEHKTVQLLDPESLAESSFTTFAESHDHIPPQLTSRGMRIYLPLQPDRSSGKVYACLTLVSLHERDSHLLCVSLRPPSARKPSYVRALGAELVVLPRAPGETYDRKLIYVDQPLVRLVGNLIWKPPKDLHRGWNHELLFLKQSVDVDGDCHFICNFPSLLSMETFLSFRDSPFGGGVDSSTLSHDEAELIDARIRILAHRRHHVKSEDFTHMLMHNKATSCYFISPDPDNNLMIVTLLDSRTIGFLVTFSSSQDKPWCQATQFDPTSTIASTQASLPIDPMSYQSDRTTVDFKMDTESSEADARFTVSIRRLASYTAGTLIFPRCVLSIDVKYF